MCLGLYRYAASCVKSIYKNDEQTDVLKKRRGVSVQSELPNVIGRIGSVDRRLVLVRFRLLFLLLLRIIMCGYKVLTMDRMDQLAAGRADEHSVVLHDGAPIPVLGRKLDDVAVGIVANLCSG